MENGDQLSMKSSQEINENIRIDIKMNYEMNSYLFIYFKCRFMLLLRKWILIME